MLRPTLAALLLVATAAQAAPPDFSALETQERAIAETWARLPYAARNAQFVSRKAEVYGDYQPRASNVFAPGEKLLSYLEPVGYGYKPSGTDTHAFGVTVDFEILSPDGKVLAGQKKLLEQSMTSRFKNREFFINLTMSIDGAPAGSYVLAYIMTDAATGKTTRVEQPFTIKG